MVLSKEIKKGAPEHARGERASRLRTAKARAQGAGEEAGQKQREERAQRKKEAAVSIGRRAVQSEAVKPPPTYTELGRNEKQIFRQ